MKKVFLSVFAILAFSAVMFAQSANGPKLTLASATLDYGKVEYNGNGLRSASFTNTGNEPLIIKSARGNCGCTVPKWPKEPIAPGETKTIEVQYSTNRVGPINKQVTLVTNEAENSTHVIRLSGEVLPDPNQSQGVPAGQKTLVSPTNK